MNDEYVKRIELAEKLVTEAHKGQFRKDGKTPFITHPLEVVKLVRKYVCNGESDVEDTVLIISTLAHDCVEDIEDFDLDEFVNTLYDENYFYERNRIKLYVLALTKNNTLNTRIEKDVDCYDRIMDAGLRCIKIKLCDRLHNVSDMEGMTNPFKIRYLTETYYMLGYFNKYRDYDIYQELLKLTDKRLKELLK